MPNNYNLRNTIRQLMNAATETVNGHLELLQMLVSRLDFTAMEQAVRRYSQPVFAYESWGNVTVPHHGKPLFQRRATLLLSEQECCGGEDPHASRTLEVWLLDDLSAVVAACYRMEYDCGAYITEYRIVRGDVKNSGIAVDPLWLYLELDALCHSEGCSTRPLYSL